MWFANAKLARHRPRLPPKGVDDYALFVIPDNFRHDGPFGEMSTRGLFDTLEALLWLLDGNARSTVDRTPAWFAECKDMLEQVRQRAYDLATAPHAIEEVDMQEYRLVAPRQSRAVVEARDTDDEEEAEDLGDLEAMAAESAVHTNGNFAWDFDSMLTCADTALRGLDRLRVVADERVSLKATRKKLIEHVQNDALRPDFLIYRLGYEYELTCNTADMRIFERKQPLAVRPSAKTAVIAKRISLDIDKLIGHDLAKLLEEKDPAVYRLNMDAAARFASLKGLFGVDIFDKLILKDWEARPPENLPHAHILWVRAGCFWAVVHKFPDVIRCTSLLAAYLVVKRTLPELLVPSAEEGFPPQRVTLKL